MRAEIKAGMIGVVLSVMPAGIRAEDACLSGPTAGQCDDIDKAAKKARGTAEREYKKRLKSASKPIVVKDRIMPEAPSGNIDQGAGGVAAPDSGFLLSPLPDNTDKPGRDRTIYGRPGGPSTLDDGNGRFVILPSEQVVEDYPGTTGGIELEGAYFNWMPSRIKENYSNFEMAGNTSGVDKDFLMVLGALPNYGGRGIGFMHMRPENFNTWRKSVVNIAANVQSLNDPYTAINTAAEYMNIAQRQLGLSVDVGREKSDEDIKTLAIAWNTDVSLAARYQQDGYIDYPGRVTQTALCYADLALQMFKDKDLVSSHAFTNSERTMKECMLGPGNFNWPRGGYRY